jgi:uncharacterized Fe-S cluster protein YjdI
VKLNLGFNELGLGSGLCRHKFTPSMVGSISVFNKNKDQWLVPALDLGPGLCRHKLTPSMVGSISVFKKNKDQWLVPALDLVIVYNFPVIDFI